MTLVDTRAAEAALDCESAVYAVAEQTKQARMAVEHTRVHSALTRACLDAALNFDVRQTCGNPIKVLPRESSFHDLVIVSFPADAQSSSGAVRLSTNDLCELLQLGLQPLIVLHPRVSSVQRVLLVYDGTEASSRAIRTFLNLDLFAGADCRLLAVGENESSARRALGEMADYCVPRRQQLETGYVCGLPRDVVPSYAEKWNADLVVLGVNREPHLRRRLLGHAVRSLLEGLERSCFLTM